jgi:hypothetical protein
MSRNTLLDIERLAKQERSEPGRAFFTRQFGQVAYREMSMREGLLSAVLEIYRGNTGNYIDPYPAETEVQARNKVGRIQFNLLMSFMNKWNTLYTEEPTRVFEYDGVRLKEDDKRAEVLSEQYRKAHVNDIMEQADTFMRLTGVVALRPWFDADNDELVTHCYTANNIRVIQNPNNPKRPYGIALVGQYKKEESDGGAILVDQAEFFTAEKAGVVNGSKTTIVDLETEEMPVAFGWEKYPTNKTGFYVDCPGPALAAIDRLIANDFTSHYGFVTIMQGFGIPVTWGMQKGQLFKIGPGETIDFDGDPDTKEDFDFRNPNAPLEEIGKVISQLIDWARETYDIPKSMLDASMTSSGVAQVEANAPLGWLRQKRAKQLRPLEQHFCQRTADVLIASGKLDGDPKLYGVSVFYPESKVSQSTNDQLARDKFELETGLTTRAVIYMRDNPDQFDTEEEAEKFLASRSVKLAPDEEGGDVVDGETSPSLSTEGAKDVANEAMNGAQVAALQGLVIAVSEKTMPAESAKLVAQAAFPTIPEANLTAMFGAAESFVPKPEPKPAMGVPTNVRGNEDTPGPNTGN